MFSGIIEEIGILLSAEPSGSNIIFTFRASFAQELKIDQSLAHNGVCLTVTNIQDDTYQVVAVKETLDKTNLKSLKVGSTVNLERCLAYGGRIDGHIVQGHVDQTGIVSKIIDEKGSWRFFFEYDPTLGNITVEKGSICVNGTSLTVVDSQKGKFSVAIIPYTYENTIFKNLSLNDEVNLEFDILGKYVSKLFNSQLESFANKV